MQAKDLYEIGKKAYNGDTEAGKSFFETMAAIVKPIAAEYGLLPSYVMAKLVIESGWMTDIWNATAERLTGKTFRKKAQEFNNIFGMNCWSDNQKYLERLPLPAWAGYRTTFNDWGPHGYGDTFHVKWEMWKSYRSVEDAIEDWCANIRYQAEAHGHNWNPTGIKAQLLATESYTPEGSAEGVREGLHFQWQEKVMLYYENYGLKKYDEEVEPKVSKVKMTTANLDQHIKAAYEYAHANCHYAPCLGFPPMADGAADCVGLVYRALYTMGYMGEGANIDQIGEACIKAGMKMSTDVSDVCKHHGVVCMQGNHLYGTPHVTHVYYSLGGTSQNDIRKYDLGSDARIKEHTQPYVAKPVNEWTDKYHFFMFFYPEDAPEKRKDEPGFEPGQEGVGVIRVNTGMYAGPGTKWKKLKTLKAGAVVRYGLRVTNDAGHDWRRVVCGNTAGYVYHTAVKRKEPFGSYDATVSGTDGSLALRVAAGAGAYKIADIPEGKSVTVNGTATANDGSEWLHVLSGKKIRGFVSAKFIKKATTKKGKE